MPYMANLGEYGKLDQWECLPESDKASSSLTNPGGRHNTDSSEHRKGKTIGAIDIGGGELSDRSAFDDELVSSSSAPACEATAAGPTSSATGTST
ncbi:hypothetical protein Tco_0326591 [Tanacetum coccineum]